MSFLEKIQNLPEKKKKIIFWTVIAVSSLILTFLFIKNAGNILEKYKNTDRQGGAFPDFLKEIDMPKFELPESEISTSSENNENI